MSRNRQTFSGVSIYLQILRLHCTESERHLLRFEGKSNVGMWILFFSDRLCERLLRQI